MTQQWSPSKQEEVPIGPPRTSSDPFDPNPPDAEASVGAGRDGSTPSGRWRVYLLAGGGYLTLSVVLWWHVLPHPNTVTTCGCGDAALTLWVIRWPAYALSHGLNPFFSPKLLVPRGINMAPNSLGLGIGTAPVTWLFGPVASLNLIDLVSPPVSALAMFWLLRRWVRWTPAAIVGGLFFGFSPFVLVSLALAHPNFGFLAPVPLIVGCIDDLFVRHRFRPLWVGFALGLLLTIEFFVSVEVLLLVFLFAVLAAFFIGVRSMFGTRLAVRGPVVEAAPALGVAAGVALILLAYPLWFFFAGPAHLVGRAWPNSPSGTVENSPGDFFNGFVSGPLTGVMHIFGGYQGPTLPLLGTLGFGVVVVVVGGSVIWRRDPLVRFFSLLGLLAAVLSLGAGHGFWTPWRLFVHLPVLNNIVPVNITAIVDTCVAILLALVIDHTRRSARLRSVGGRGTAAALAVAAAALVPLVVALWPNIPMTVRPVVVPVWFTSRAPRLGSHLVVLPYPSALGGIESSMAWQASEGLTFSMVGGGGPGIVPSRAGPERPGFNVLARVSLSLSPPPMPTSANLHAIRQALAGWRVTTVVVPEQSDMPSYNSGRPVPYAVGLFTVALGQPPIQQSKAWVWNDVRHAPSAMAVSPSDFAACIGGNGSRSTALAVAACVLHRR